MNHDIWTKTWTHREAYVHLYKETTVAGPTYWLTQAYIESSNSNISGNNSKTNSHNYNNYYLS